MMPSEIPDHAPPNLTPSVAPASSATAGIFTQPVFAGRLHPLTIAFGLLKAGRGIVPLIPLLLFGNKKLGFGLLALTVVGTVATTLIRYFSFSVRIEGDELITQEGLLERKQRSIPLTRIQEIRVEQGVLHRLFNVAEAKIETGSGAGAEASLSVLARAEIERLRQAVFARAAQIKAEAAPANAEPINAPQPEAITIRQLSFTDLLLIGLTTNHLLSALVLLGALWNFADDVLPASIYGQAGKFISRHITRISAQDAATAAAIAVAGLLLSLLALFLIGVLFSTIGAFVLFYGFTLSARGEDLQRRYGLFTQRASSLPRRRIQTLKIEEKLLRRWLGLAALRADTSGSRRDDKDDNTGRDTLLPLARRAEIEDLLPRIFPDFHADEMEWRRVSPLAVRRGFNKGAIVCMLLAIVSFIVQRSLLAAWPLLLLPLIYFISRANYRSLGYALSEHHLRTRRGWLGRATHIVPLNKIQAVEIRQSPFERRWGLATLSVDTAGQAYTGGGPQINNLPLPVARALAEVLAHRAAATRYRW
jgi:putative membrane protein